MKRGRRLLQAQRPGRPVLPPDEAMAPDEVAARDEIVAACPDVLRHSDSIWLDISAAMLADWRRRRGGYVRMPLSIVREHYRFLGDAFMPMRERRRLLFPERVKGK